jgi:hypothetical protein
MPTWLTLLGPLIPQLVTAAESLFGPKTGGTKLNTVVSAIQPIVNNLATTGKLGGPPPAATDIAAAVSATAAQLFPSGTSATPVGSPPVSPVTVVAPPAQPIVSGDLKKSLKALLVWALTD